MNSLSETRYAGQDLPLTIFGPKGLAGTSWLWTTVAPVFFFVVLVSVIHYFDQYRFVHLPLHSAIETLGAAVAMLVGMVIFQQGRTGNGLQTQCIGVAFAYLAMGILDLAHACMSTGNLFVWFHTLAVFTGGAFFALGWFRSFKMSLLAMVFGALALVISLSLFFPGTVPKMIDGNRFTSAACALNIFGGLLFLVAIPRLLIRIRKHRQSQTLIFAGSAALFGVSGLLFPWSEAWGLDWWVWHGLRLVAYGVAAILVVQEYRWIYTALTHRLAEKEASEQALRLSQERLTLVTQANGIGMWEWNLQTQELTWDDTMFRLHGLRREDFSDVYEAWRVSVSPDELGAAEAALQRAIEGPAPFDYDFRVVHPGGGVHYINAKATVVRDKEGLPLRMVGTNWDITSRKKMEMELEERRIAAEEANQLLEEKNRELDEFTYVASHDLQEPLRKITAFSSLLPMDLGVELPDKARKDLDFITDAASRMQTLIQSLLSLSRSGRKEMLQERVALDQCLDDALQALGTLLDETGADISRDRLPEVVGDRIMLTQLYQNLLSNALKFVTGRRPKVHLSAKIEGSWAVLGVQDNGIGIKPEYMEQIFQPFKRLHRKGEFAGSGIGLAICRKVVERHGGEIWVESEPGEGTLFAFTLPKPPE